jgi:cytochrome c oxidase subunit 3
MDAVHTAPSRAIERPRLVAVGSALAATGVAMYFAGLIGVYLFDRAQVLHSGGDWLSKVTIPLTPPNVMMLTLVFSCVTMQWALYAVARNDRTHAFLALGVTLLFAAAVVNSQFWMYQQMQLVVAETMQAVLIYAITGSFLALLVSAAVYLAAVTFRTLGGQYGPHQHDGIVGAAIYWYVMVAVYAVIWIAVYVTK